MSDKYDAVAPRLNQLAKIEKEKEQRRLDELKRLQARNEELELQVKELKAEITRLKKPNICHHITDRDEELYYKEDETNE